MWAAWVAHENRSLHHGCHQLPPSPGSLSADLTRRHWQTSQEARQSPCGTSERGFGRRAHEIKISFQNPPEDPQYSSSSPPTTPHHHPRRGRRKPAGAAGERSAGGRGVSRRLWSDREEQLRPVPLLAPERAGPQPRGRTHQLGQEEGEGDGEEQCEPRGHVGWRVAGGGRWAWGGHARTLLGSGFPSWLLAPGS